jgi:hypothetical protein
MRSPKTSLVAHATTTGSRTDGFKKYCLFRSVILGQAIWQKDKRTCASVRVFDDSICYSCPVIV